MRRVNGRVVLARRLELEAALLADLRKLLVRELGSNLDIALAAAAIAALALAARARRAALNRAKVGLPQNVPG